MISYIFNTKNLHESRAVPKEFDNVFQVINTGQSFTSSLEMTTIACQPNEQCVVLQSAIGSPVPLFWGWSGEDLVVSDSAAQIISLLNTSPNISLDDIDEIGFLESLLFDGPLGERTLFKKVKKVQCAEIVKIGLVGKSVEKNWRWLPKIQMNSEMKPGEAYAQAKHYLGGLMEDVNVPENGILLPITGGLDSRLLAALVREKSSAPIYSYTFQRGWSFESWCAKKVARKVGAAHTIFNLDKKCYGDFARRSAELSGGFVTGMHTHGIYCCEELLDPSLKAVPRMFGYLGEHVTGAMTDELHEGNRLSTPDSVLKKYSNCLFPGLVEKYRSEIISDLEDTYAAFKQSGSPKHCFHEFWRVQQRQSNLITHLFHYHRSHCAVEVIEPFVNSKFIDFFLNLPFAQRFNRSLFKQVCKDVFPQIFSLPSMHYDVGSIYAKAEFLCAKIESFANKVNIRQEVFLSPFNYEQHEKNLQNYLSGDVNAGLDLMSQLYDIPKVKICYPTWKQKSSAKEHYRMAMLHHLVKL